MPPTVPLRGSAWPRGSAGAGKADMMGPGSPDLRSPLTAD
jgi:hypothetical protein